MDGCSVGSASVFGPVAVLSPCGFAGDVLAAGRLRMSFRAPPASERLVGGSMLYYAGGKRLRTGRAPNERWLWEHKAGYRSRTDCSLWLRLLKPSSEDDRGAGTDRHPEQWRLRRSLSTSTMGRRPSLWRGPTHRLDQRAFWVGEPKM